MDYIVVGCGFFGSVFAREMAESGKKVLIIDKRKHIAGNCYSEKIEGINVHRFGPHSFHTNNEEVWAYLNRFTKFNDFKLHVKVNFNNKIYSFPINMNTLHQVWGVITPEQAKAKLEQVKIKTDNPNNLEDWICSQIGTELYETFVKGYTSKQWNKHPKELPSSIIKRIPIRLTYDDRYHSDKYQGVPIGGFTRMFENILDHENIKVELGVDFFENRKELENVGKLVYTGKIDELFGYEYGELEYRSLRFENEVLDGDYQGTAQINYTDQAIPFTRIVEHKHFEFLETPKTVVTKEFPESYDKFRNEPLYPIRDEKNTELYKKYKTKVETGGNIIVAGRLGTYFYFDMDSAASQALNTAKTEKGKI